MDGDCRTRELTRVSNGRVRPLETVILIVRQKTEGDMTMKGTSILRTAYWGGSIADLAFGFLLIAFPSLSLKIYGINTELSPAVRFWMVYAGVAIFSWTAFLIWGLRQLEERKFVALATVIVVLGFAIVEIVGIIFGTVSAINMVALLAVQVVLVGLLLVGYCKA